MPKVKSEKKLTAKSPAESKTLPVVPTSAGGAVPTQHVATYKPPTLELKTPGLALFQARRGSGKTHLMKYLTKLLASGHKFDWVRVITPTAFNGEWKQCVGNDFVHEELDEDWLMDLLDRQADSVERKKQNRGLLILDDALGAVRFNSPIWTRISASSRHYNITVWISTQHLFKLPPVVRVNCDYIFCLGIQPARTIKALYEEYSPSAGQRTLTEQELGDFLTKSRENYGCCLFDVAKATVHIIRAPALVRFRIQQ